MMAGELWKVVLTAGLTIFGSVVVLVFGQLLQKLVIEPVNDQRKAISHVDYNLTFWAWAYANPDEQRNPMRDRAMDELREAAAKLLATTNSIRCWPLANIWGATPEESADRAARLMIGLANAVYGRYVAGEHPSPREDADRVRNLLALRLAARERGLD